MRRRLTPWLLTAPAALIFAGLFVAPFAYFFVISFWSVKLYRLSPGFTLANYGRAFGGYIDIGLFTIGLALVTAVLTTFLGLVYAYIVRFKAGRWATPLLFTAMLTLFGGYLMKIYAWKTILGNEGVLNSSLIAVGLIDRPIAALLYSPTAVVITLLYFLLPVAILPIYGALRTVEDVELEAARDLGARPLAVLWDIVLPRCRIGLVAAFALSFLIAAGDYVTPQFVGGIDGQMLGNVIAEQFGTAFNWPLGSALAFLLVAAMGLVIAAWLVLMRLFGLRGAR